MIKIKNVLNDLSDELLAEIPKLEPGQTRTLQALWGVKVHDAENANVFKLEFGKRRFNLKDKIYDTYKKTTVDIGVPNIIEGDRVIDYKKFAPGETENQFGGRFSLSGDNPDDVEIFEFLMLSNKVKNNKHRNKSEEPLLELLGVVETQSNATINAPQTIVVKPKIKEKETVTV